MSNSTDIINQNRDTQQALPQSDTKMLIDGLFNPIIRVIPAHDWSKIKAIWIPLLHHDYDNQLARSERITILRSRIDKFGTMQGYLTAPNENYIPYLTTFFNPTWTQDFVIEQILQAHSNVIESIATLVDDDDNERIVRQLFLGKTKLGMFIKITLNDKKNIIDASPIFCKE